MSLTHFLEKIRREEPVSFDETQAIIREHYDYQPTEFSNGSGEDVLTNQAGQNEGSCRIFAFAQLNELTEQQTLALFGDYYWRDVLDHPDGNDHIRTFQRHGWAGITFKGVALTPR